jgi:hypothetical protein
MIGAAVLVSAHGKLMNWKQALRLSFSPALIYFLVSPLFSQTAGNAAPPLGDLVKKSKKAPGPKAKTVITDETLAAQRGPIPGIALDGVDNSDEIIRAIREFKKAHSPAETEEAVRLWYDDSDSILLKALDDNSRLIVRKEDRNLANATGEYASRMDYEGAMERRNSQIREDRNDFRSYRQNGFLVARVQQVFMKVRTDMQSCNLRYDWFKIRNANGNGSF